MIVRAIQIAEAGEWARLRGRLWPDADPQELTAETQAFLEGAEMPTIAAAFVAREEEGDEAIGFLELGVRPFADGCESRPVAHVEGWYVEPAARGRGVGRALMTAAEIGPANAASRSSRRIPKWKTTSPWQRTCASAFSRPSGSSSSASRLASREERAQDCPRGAIN